MRSNDPIPLTMNEHAELGAELRKTRARLQELCNLVVGVYGPQNRVSFSFERAVEAMDRLCNEMQAQAARDLPERQVNGIYS
jgi:hypothetical protein